MPRAVPMLVRRHRRTLVCVTGTRSLPVRESELRSRGGDFGGHMSGQTKQLKHCLSNSGIEKDGSYIGVKLCSRKHKDTGCPYLIPLKR